MSVRCKILHALGIGPAAVRQIRGGKDVARSGLKHPAIVAQQAKRRGRRLDLDDIALRPKAQGVAVADRPGEASSLRQFVQLANELLCRWMQHVRRLAGHGDMEGEPARVKLDGGRERVVQSACRAARPRASRIPR